MNQEIEDILNVDSAAQIKKYSKEKIVNAVIQAGYFDQSTNFDKVTVNTMIDTILRHQQDETVCEEMVTKNEFL